jgi:hypothetical protein
MEEALDVMRGYGSAYGLSVGLSVLVTVVGLLVLAAVFMAVYNVAMPVLASPWSSNANNTRKMNYAHALCALVLLLIVGAALFGSLRVNTMVF